MQDKLTRRSVLTEMLDEPSIPKNQLIRNMQELDFLNRKMGGHAITLKGIARLVTDKEKEYRLADLGCGSGDLMKYLASWARSEGFKMRLTGIDIREEAIEHLWDHCREYSEISGIIGDYSYLLKNSSNIDIYVCSLFCHHLQDSQMADLIKQFRLHAKVGFVINDLRRSWLAWFSVKIFTFLWKGSKMAKHDGPVSVLRGFRRSELECWLDHASVSSFTIRRGWGFRWLVTAFC